MMMKRFVFIILCSLWAWATSGQKEEHVWIFGSNAGLDFNGGTPVPLSAPTGMITGEGCASVCDAAGSLLFYTDGNRVWNRNFMAMPNGSGLAFTSSTTQGAVIVPIPDDPDRYYIFSLEPSHNPSASNGMLYYSVVDMSLQGGLGDVVAGQKGVLLDAFLTEKMTAVAGNDCNVWLVVRPRAGGFKAYEITASGISPVPVTSNTGLFAPEGYVAGVIKVSPDRRRIAAGINPVVTTGVNNKGVELYDFNPADGSISGAVQLDTTMECYGVCFSPDNSKLYISNINYDIYQFDLAQSGVPAIIASKTYIGRVPSGGNIGGADLKTGSDGKMYISGLANPLSICYINAPDVTGTACGFISPGILLPPGAECRGGLPNAIALPDLDTVYTRIEMTVCFRDSAILQADTSGWAYTWNDGSRLDHISVGQSGTYVAGYRAKGCRYQVDSFYVRFIVQPPGLNTLLQSCKGERRDMAWVTPAGGDTSAYTWRWYTAADSLLRQYGPAVGPDTLWDIGAGGYKLYITAASGCDTVLPFTIAPPAYQASFITDSIICQGVQTSFTNTATGLDQWKWYFGDGDSSEQHSPGHIYSVPGVYRVSLIAANHVPCYDTATMLIVVDTMPSLAFVTDRDSICAGESIRFHAVFDREPTSMHWDFGSGTRLAAGRQPAFSFDGSGNHVVTLTGEYDRCPDTTFLDTITVFPYPVVDLGPDTAVCPGAPPVRLSNRAVQLLSVTGNWSTGETGDHINIHDPGVYWLTLQSERGCTTTDSITVARSCYIDIPNVFSPNGDGVNDYFFPRTLLAGGLTHFRMQVFNRWGQVIFETNAVDGRGWDGSFNGMIQPQGVYVYLIEVSFANHLYQTYRGNVTLIR